VLRENVAVQLFAASIVTEASVQSVFPLQPAKYEPSVGLLFKVTTVFRLYDFKQVVPQLIPDGVEVAVPVPVPDLVIVKAVIENVAVQVFVASIVTVPPKKTLVGLAVKLAVGPTAA
jgi:hypothetical protein